MELRVTVYKNRDYLGKLSLINNFGKTLGEFEVSAKSDPDFGVLDPPTGHYRLLTIKSTSGENSGVISAYGDSVIYFERISGNPVRSNCEGKFILAIYGSAFNDALLPTDGGIRLRNSDLRALVDTIKDQNTTLSITEENNGFLGWLTHSRVSKGKAPYLRLSYHGNRRMRECYRDDDDTLFWIMMYMLWNDDDSGIDDPGVTDIDGGVDDGPTDDSGPIVSDPIEDVAPLDVIEPGPPLIVDPFVSETPVTPSVSEPSIWDRVEMGNDKPTESVFTHVDMGSESSTNSWTHEEANGTGY
jgi:hypothetical protein